MRELANSSARSAIAKHHQRRHLEKALISFLVCVMALLVGGYLLLTAKSYVGAPFIGGCMMVAIRAYGGGKLMGLLLSAIREGAWEAKSPQTPQEISVEEDSLPIDGSAGPDGDLD